MKDPWGNVWYRVLVEGHPAIKFRSFKHLASMSHLFIRGFTLEARKANEEFKSFPVEILQAYLSTDPNKPKEEDENCDKPISNLKLPEFAIFHDGKQLFKVEGKSIARLFCTRLIVPYEVFTVNNDGTMTPYDLELCPREEFLDMMSKAWREDHQIIKKEIKKRRSKNAA